MNGELNAYRNTMANMELASEQFLNATTTLNSITQSAQRNTMANAELASEQFLNASTTLNAIVADVRRQIRDMDPSFVGQALLGIHAMVETSMSEVNALVAKLSATHAELSRHEEPIAQTVDMAHAIVKAAHDADLVDHAIGLIVNTNTRFDSIEGHIRQMVHLMLVITVTIVSVTGVCGVFYCARMVRGRVQCRRRQPDV